MLFDQPYMHDALRERQAGKPAVGLLCMASQQSCCRDTQYFWRFPIATAVAFCTCFCRLACLRCQLIVISNLSRTHNEAATQAAPQSSSSRSRLGSCSNNLTPLRCACVRPMAQTAERCCRACCKVVQQQRRVRVPRRRPHRQRACTFLFTTGTRCATCNVYLQARYPYAAYTPTSWLLHAAYLAGLPHFVSTRNTHRHL